MHNGNNAAGGATASPWDTDTEVSPGQSPLWTRRCDKLLELLVVRYSDRWDIIVPRLGSKTQGQAIQRYMRTVDEVKRVLHAPEVETPREWDMQLEVAAAAPPAGAAAVGEMPIATAAVATVASAGEEAAAIAENSSVPASSNADGETSDLRACKRKNRGGKRKKPEKWTVEEHRLFLEGLEKYGKGKWKTMSSEYLTTKTASQIASHDQKHRKRLEQRKCNGCKRASIHDITEPTSAAAAVVADGDETGAQKGRGREVESEAPGELVREVEECSDDEYDLEGLFM